MDIDPEQFWRLTPAEFWRKGEAFGRKQMRRRNELIYLAWHVEAFARQKRLPDLESLITDTASGKRHQQTDDDMMAVCRMLNAAYGGDFVEV